MERDALIQRFSNQRVLIWGFGLEGKSTYNFLVKYCETSLIEIADDQHVEHEKVKTYLSTEVNFHEYDIIMKSPGIVIKDDTFPLQKLQSQSQLFLECYKDKIIGITGTKGKSTTSSLLYHVLKENLQSVFLVGNIGLPCFDVVHELEASSKVVFEISCHQLEYATVSPHIAVLLNLYEEHIDHYGTFAKYIAAKENIFLHQGDGDVAIINHACHEQVKKAKHCLTSSMNQKGDIYAMGTTLVNPNGQITMDASKITLLGHHNYYNMAIVYMIAHQLLGVSDEAFVHAVSTFKTLAHRLQHVGIVDGVRYVDDSISTICESTIQAIESLGDVDTVLVGGMDRGIDYEPLIEFLKSSHVNSIVLMYATGKRIYESMNEIQGKQMVVVDDLYQAVAIAKQVTAKGKTCLLSPAAASYGYFKNFEERGDVFQALVKQHEV